MADKYVSGKIAEIRQMAQAQIPQAIASAKQTGAMYPYPEYRKLRLGMNLKIIEAMVGSDTEAPKKGVRPAMKYGKALPTLMEISELTAILEKFVNEVEAPYYNEYAQFISAQTQQGQAPDPRIGIPGPATNTAGVPMMSLTGLPDVAIDKITQKGLRSYLFGENEGTIGGAYGAGDIGPADVARLAALGKRAREDHNLKVGLVVGGITILIIGGIVAAILIIRHKRKQEENIVDLDNPDNIVDLDDEKNIVDVDASISSGAIPYVKL